MRDLELAASLHDIGKVAIPDRILLKPARLTREETLSTVRDEVNDTHLIDLGMEIAGGHHERWDGGGYPRGLRGERIPLAARIVAVADVFDALMSKRVYKSAMPFEEVERIIEEGRGSHFDPEIVDAFHAVSGELVALRARLQDSEGPASLLPHRGVAGAPEADAARSR